MRTYEHIAYLLMLMLKKSGKSRFRLSRKSLQAISGRAVIKTALIGHIADWMEGTAIMLPLNRGGYVVIAQESLEGVASLQIANVIEDWKKMTLEDLREQVGSIEDEEDDE